MSAIPLSAMDLISGEAIDARGSGSRPHVEPPYAPNPAEARDVADDGVPWVGGRGRAAERERLRALVDAHFDAVWCALRRLGVLETELDDAAQQVFLVASRRLEDIEQGRERAFLLGAAAHVASHARRAHRRRREVPEPLDEALDRTDPGPLPDEALDRKRLRALLDAALASLSDDLRTVFVLFELEELSMPQIASILGIPTGTVASRLRRAREEIERWSARRAIRGAVR